MKDVPVLLLTGYLGSGKTTLVNRILANEKGIKFAVIVNDIGEVNIDADLIQQGGVVNQNDDSLVALQNHSCTIRDMSSKSLDFALHIHLYQTHRLRQRRSIREDERQILQLLHLLDSLLHRKT